MLEKPDLQDEKIIACLQAEYGLLDVQIAFLPLGADLNTAVYRATTREGTSYFVKLRSGVLDEITVTLPKFLSDQGIGAIIPPLAARMGQLWASLDAFKLILYPFVEGRNGYEVGLTDRQWRELGAALKRIHTAVLPAALTRRIPQETYTPQWRESLKTSLQRIEKDGYDDPVAVKVAVLMRAKRADVLDLVGRAERHAAALQARSPELILCHSDIHAGNILIGANGAPSNGVLYIVDWDNPILAPKERDLMYIGGGQQANWRTPQEEEVLFYQGYGLTGVDPVALAYYRYERIVQDIAIYCEQLLLSREGGEDREQSFRYLMSNFLPHGVIEITYQSDKTHTKGD